MTLDPGNLRIVVSKCIREEFENGKTYYKLEGQLLREPSHGRLRPIDTGVASRIKVNIVLPHAD
jgi:putative restriction endonuclease